MTTRLCSINVDLDPLTAYYEIHGLGGPPPRLNGTIMRKALPRLEELFREAGVPSTLFVVGRELERSDEGAAVLARMAEAGHEIGNHTYSHPYDLCRLPEQVIDQELRRTEDLIRERLGEAHLPRGFRTPGYHANGRLMSVLIRRGYRYDTSMFPSPPYYAAKAAVMAGMFVRGRRSGAVLASPAGLTAPGEPYRPDTARPWRRGDAPLVELPVSVTAGLRLPAIGTTIAVAPAWLRQRVLAGIARRAFYNFELHAIDVLDAVEDRIPTQLAGRQPDLRVPYAQKRERFLRFIEELSRTFSFVTLGEAARRLEAEGRV